MMQEDSPSPLASIQARLHHFSRLYQSTLDRWTPHVYQRWLATGGLLLIFGLRVLLAQGWYIVAYAHAIYLLNLLLAFLQPRFDPSLREDLAADEVEEGGSADLPTSNGSAPADDEFRPFVRRLPEWQFWLGTTRATLIAVVCTTTQIFDVPVYWPILVCYFFILFSLTMRRQIQHMIKYKYLPWDMGRKTRYGGTKQAH